MAADRKPVLIRAEPSLWSQVESYAAKEGLTRNEAVIRLLGVGLDAAPKQVVVTVTKPDPKPVRVVVRTEAVDLPVGPVRQAPGSRLKGKK